MSVWHRFKCAMAIHVLWVDSEQVIMPFEAKCFMRVSHKILPGWNMWWSQNVLQSSAVGLQWSWKCLLQVQSSHNYVINGPNRSCKSLTRDSILLQCDAKACCEFVVKPNLIMSVCCKCTMAVNVWWGGYVTVPSWILELVLGLDGLISWTNNCRQLECLSISQFYYFYLLQASQKPWMYGAISSLTSVIGLNWLNQVHTWKM